MQSPYLVGGSILLGLFLYLRMRKKKEPIKEIQTGYRPSPLAPLTDQLTFDEIYQWIKKEESVRYKAYRDGRDKQGNQLFSIGYGHQIQPKEKDLLTRTITEDEALMLLKKDIDGIRVQLNRLIKVPLNKNQQLAILSLRYNIGPAAFADSTLLKLLNQGNYTGAALEFPKWRLSEGKISNVLVLRRERERNLFSTPPNQAVIGSVKTDTKEAIRKQLIEAQDQINELIKKRNKDGFLTPGDLQKYNRLVDTINKLNNQLK
jgi:lysozyme